MHHHEHEPLSDLANDCLCLIQNKAQAIRAYETYIEDARRANSPECVDLFRRICDRDRRQIEEARRHLRAMLSAEADPDEPLPEASLGEESRVCAAQLPDCPKALETGEEN